MPGSIQGKAKSCKTLLLGCWSAEDCASSFQFKPKKNQKESPEHPCLSFKSFIQTSVYAKHILGQFFLTLSNYVA